MIVKNLLKAEQLQVKKKKRGMHPMLTSGEQMRQKARRSRNAQASIRPLVCVGFAQSLGLRLAPLLPSFIF